MKSNTIPVPDPFTHTDGQTQFPIPDSKMAATKRYKQTIMEIGLIWCSEQLHYTAKGYCLSRISSRIMSQLFDKLIRGTRNCVYIHLC